jgi:hypothetical protein
MAEGEQKETEMSLQGENIHSAGGEYHLFGMPLPKLA